MKSKNELSYKDLKMTCNENLFNFNTTEELEKHTNWNGQDRGINGTRIWITSKCKRL